MTSATSIDAPSMPSTNCTARGRATCWYSCRASAKSATRPRPCASIGPHAAHLEILPLFARLWPRNSRASSPHGGRRIVLATNVAETSLTVPGIRYVVDTGLARVKRYSYRNKGRAAAGREDFAGRRQPARRPLRRVAAGICIRLYDEMGFKARLAFTDPEILRSSLAGVILRMKSLGSAISNSSCSSSAVVARRAADGYQLLCRN